MHEFVMCCDVFFNVFLLKLVEILRITFAVLPSGALVSRDLNPYSSSQRCVLVGPKCDWQHQRSIVRYIHFLPQVPEEMKDFFFFNQIVKSYQWCL